MVQTPIGTTSDADDAIEPMCHKHGDDSAEHEVERQQREGTDEDRDSNSSNAEDKMSALDILICPVVNEGKKPAGEKGVSKADAYGQPHGHFKPCG